MNAATEPTPATLAERELVLTRIIDAPRARVFEVWTKRLTEWWGPHGIITPFCEMDLRPGGIFRTVMRAPDGTEYPTTGVFLEVVRNKRIVFTDAYDAGWQPSTDIFFTAITTSRKCPAVRRSTPRAPFTGPWKTRENTNRWVFTTVGVKALIVSLPSLPRTEQHSPSTTPSP